MRACRRLQQMLDRGHRSVRRRPSVAESFASIAPTSTCELRSSSVWAWPPLRRQRKLILPAIRRERRAGDQARFRQSSGPSG